MGLHGISQRWGELPFLEEEFSHQCMRDADLFLLKIDEGPSVNECFPQA
jgi:hypothetical protein